VNRNDYNEAVRDAVSGFPHRGMLHHARTLPCTPTDTPCGCPHKGESVAAYTRDECTIRRNRRPGRGASNGGGREHAGNRTGRVGRNQCRKCGKTGHWARDCPSKPNNGKAHLAQAEEEEGTLLLARVNTVQLRSPVHGGGGGTPSVGKGAKLEATRVQIRPPAASIQGLEAPPVQMAQLMASTLAEKGRLALAPAPVPTSAVEQVPACRGTQQARQVQVEATAADPAVEAPRATKGKKPPSLAAEGHTAAGRPSALLPVLEELRATTEQTRVHLVEARAHVQLDDAGNPDDALWYLDTGATNHMTGSRAVFSDIDEHVTDTVSFGDGSLVNIEGRGTVLFSCKTGEHRQLSGVYLIPRLDINLISVR
jgi:hypothetical protein